MDAKVSLEKCWLFGGLEPSVLNKIQPFVTEKHFESGAGIFAEGDPARFLYILGQGEVELTYTLPGNTPVTMRITNVSPGEVFGWSALARGKSLSAAARALTDCAVFLVPADRLGEVMDGDPSTGYILMGRLAELIAKRLFQTRNELKWIQSYM